MKKADDIKLGSNRVDLHSIAGRNRFHNIRLSVVRMMIMSLLTFLSAIPAHSALAESLRTADYFFERAVAGKPTIHDVGERMRIANGIDPDRIGVFSGTHEAVSFPGDTEQDADDFREEAYGQLRSEIRMTYAEVASTRSQIKEIRRSLELLRQMVAVSNTLYATGKLDQLQAVKAQIEWEKQNDALLILEKREKVFSIRLNLLAGDPIEDAVPPLEVLKEYTVNFETTELVRSYKSIRFLAVFQKLVQPDPRKATGEGIQEADYLDLEANANISAAKISLENLSQRIHRYRTSFIPRAELAYSARCELYKSGKLDFATLLESLVALSDMRREYQSMLGEIHMLKARVEYMSGSTLD